MIYYIGRIFKDNDETSRTAIICTGTTFMGEQFFSRMIEPSYRSQPFPSGSDPVLFFTGSGVTASTRMGQ